MRTTAKAARATKVYAFKKDAKIPKGIDRTLALEHITDFANRNLSTVAIYEEITADPSHPLYNWYEWNPNQAMRSYHLHQTRQMMSVVEVEVTLLNKPPVTVRASVSVKERETGKYVYTDTVSSMSDPYYREQVLQDALVDLRRFQNKYHALTELADLMGVISQTIRNNDQLAKARAAKRAARGTSKKPKGPRSKKK